MPSKDLTFRLFGEDRTATSSLNKLSKSAEDASARIRTGFAPLAKLVGGIGLAAAAATAAVVATGVGEAMDASAGLAQLKAGIASTGNAANVSVGGMEALASSIQNMSGQTDDSIVKAEQLLLTFTNVKNSGPDKIFDQATQAAADMAAKMGGDASTNAIRLGKALNDPIKGVTALSKVGVTFDEGQKNQIKTLVKHGDTVKAQKIILAELNKEFGGAAKAAGQSLPGQLQRAQRAFEDVSQAVVETILPVVLPAIAKMADAVRSAQPYLQHLAKVVARELGSAFRELAPVLKDAGSFLTGTVVPAVAQLAGWLSRNSRAVLIAAAAVAVLVVGYRVVATAIAIVRLGMVAYGVAMLAVTTIQKGAAAASYGLAGATYAQGAAAKVYTVLIAAQNVATKAAAVGAGLLSAATAVGGWVARAAAIAGYGIATTAVSVATKVAAAGQWLLNAAMTANPIGIVVAAIVALVAGLVWFFTQTKLGKDIWSGFVKFLQDAWQGFTGWIAGALKAVIGFFTTWGPMILAVVMPMVGIPLLIIQNWSKIVGFFTGLGKTVIGALQGAAKWLVDSGSKILDGLIDGAKSGLLALGRWEMSIGSKVIGWLAGAGKWLVDTGHDLLSGLLEGAKKGLIAVGRWELGIATKVIGWLAGAGKWLLDTGSDLLAGLLSGAKTGLTAVAAFVTGFPGRFLKWTAGAATWLLEAGGHIVDGLVQGLRNKIRAVGQVISDIAGTVAGVFTKKTEINSPSKLFERFGKWIGEGLIKGLAGTQDDVRSAMSDLADKVSEGFTAMTEKRKQLLESTKELWKKEKQLLEDEPKVHKDKNGKISAAAKESYDDAMKAWRRRLAAIRSQEREEKAEYSKLGSTASQKALQTGLTKLIAKDTAALEVLAAKRDVLTDRLKNAQDELQKASDAYKQTYTSTFDSTFATGNVVSSYQAVAQEHAAAIDSIKSLREQLADLDSTSTTYATDKSGIQAKIADQQAIADGTGNSASRMRSTLTQQVEKTRRFQADLKQLVGMGIDPATYQQLLTAGISGGGLEAADDLLADGPGGVQQMAALQAQLKAASDSLATDAADQLNGVGVQVAQGLVDGITSQLGAVTDAMDKISAALVKTLKQKLDIHSPSRVMAGHGKQIPAGLVVGINSGRGDVESSMSALVNTRNRWATAPGSTGQPGQIPTATGERALVHIDNFHATPEQSPAEIAADLGWLTRGGL